MPKQNKRSVEQKLKFAKWIDPTIFEHKTPKIHFVILEFVNGDAKFKVVIVFRGAGKTTLLNKIECFDRIFFDAEPFTLIVSSTSPKAKSFLSELKKHILKAAEKGLDIGKSNRDSAPWNESEIEVRVGKKYCLVKAIGAGEDPRGSVADNKRPTFVIGDDIESKTGNYPIKNKESRGKLESWFLAELMPALHPDAEVLFLGTIMHEEALINKFSKMYPSINIPIIRNGIPAWPSRFPVDFINKTKETLFSLGLHHEFYNEYMGVAQAAEKQLFKPSMFRYFKEVEYIDEKVSFKLPSADEDKIHNVFLPSSIVLDDGSKIALNTMIKYSTMDLASDGADKTVIITCAYDNNGNIYVLRINAGHYNPYEKSVAALTEYSAFKPLKFGIEKGGGLNDFFYTIDQAKKSSGLFIPTEPISHGGISKSVRISHLYPLFYANKIFFNRSDPLTVELEAQLGAFNPEIDGYDDFPDTLAMQLYFTLNRTHSKSTPVKPPRHTYS